MLYASACMEEKIQNILWLYQHFSAAGISSKLKQDGFLVANAKLNCEY